MFKRWFYRILILLLLGIIIYNIWAESGRARNKRTGWTSIPDIHTKFELTQWGKDAGKGNLIGIQPYVTPKNFSTSFNFYVTLHLYFEQLKRAGLLNRKTLVVLPGDIGTWLLIAHEKEPVYNDSSFAAAMRLLKLSNLYKFTSHYLSSPEGKKRSLRSLFSMKAAEMATIYQETFSELARNFHVSIAAGSILLPEPELRQGSLVTGRGQLIGTAALFRPDGTLEAPLLFDNRQNESHYVEGGVRISLRLARDTSSEAQRSGNAYPWMNLYAGYAAKDLEDADQATVRLSFSGDLWDLRPRGEMTAGYADSLIHAEPARRKGRIVNIWLR